MANIPFSDFGAEQLPIGSRVFFSASTPISFSYGGQVFLRGGYFETNSANFDSTAWANSLGGQWQLTTSGTSTDLFTVFANGVTIIAGGNSNTAKYSIDSGRTWLNIADPAFGGSANGIRSSLYSRSLYLLGGDGGKLSTATTPSGTWTARASGMPGVGFIVGLADDGVGYVAVNAGGSITRSTNGTTGWTEVQSSITTNANPAGISYGNSYFVIPTDQTARWYRSANGTTWSAVTGPVAVSDADDVRQARFMNSLHHVWNGSYVYTSTDGNTGSWTTYNLSSVIGASNIKSVDFTGGKYLVALDTGSAWTFDTGFTNGFPAQTKLGGTTANGVCVSSSSFVIVGDGGKTAYSALQAGVDSYTESTSNVVQYVRIK